MNMRTPRELTSTSTSRFVGSMRSTAAQARWDRMRHPIHRRAQMVGVWFRAAGADAIDDVRQ
jgi:hypothetical protein